MRDALIWYQDVGGDGCRVDIAWARRARPDRFVNRNIVFFYYKKRDAALIPIFCPTHIDYRFAFVTLFDEAKSEPVLCRLGYTVKTSHGGTGHESTISLPWVRDLDHLATDSQEGWVQERCTQKADWSRVREALWIESFSFFATIKGG
jgi:hypothetical protein